jgi:predicted amidohydrolase YtcJ
VRPKAYASDAQIRTFFEANKYYPAQCEISHGKFQHERDILMEYVRRAHEAGFTLHLHAIGDAAVRAALDAIEAARAADGVTTQPDTIAHAQLVSSDDMVRMGKDHIYIAYTYSWAFAERDYDLSVIPFIDRVKDDTYASLHDPANYYEQHAYATQSAKRSGAVLIAGSDAPVGVRDPQPFFNMQLGVTRQMPGGQPLNPNERLNIRDLIKAYTINGASALGRAAEIGSLEVGKSADFIMLNQDIIALADAGHAEKIGETKVLGTWFQGRKVYSAASSN